MCQDGGKNNTCKILELSDCIMLTVLSYLDATSLYSLSRTCMYFKNIVEDHNLWRYVDARKEPNNDEKVHYCCDRIHPRTTHAFFKAASKRAGIVSRDFFLKCPKLDNLTILSLENQKLDGTYVHMNIFPKNLEELSLKKTRVKKGKMFFQYSSKRMTNLRVLILDECNWLDSSFILSLSKYLNLELLSITKCYKLEYNVPFVSVARYGFKKLKLMDCRFNSIASDLLRSFMHKELVAALYFQSMRSYEMDTRKALFKHASDMPFLRREDIRNINMGLLDNNCLREYKFAIGMDGITLPESVLYEDPYSECNCGYGERKERGISNDSNDGKCTWDNSLLPIDDIQHFAVYPQQFICHRHIDDLQKMPKEFQEFFLHNQRAFNEHEVPHVGNLLNGSDDEYSDDSDTDCCMYGMGHAQNMVILKMSGNSVEQEMRFPPELGENEMNGGDNDVDRSILTSPRQEVDEAPSCSNWNADKSDSNVSTSCLTRKNDETVTENPKNEEEEPTTSSSTLTSNKPVAPTKKRAKEKEEDDEFEPSEKKSKVSDVERPSTSQEEENNSENQRNGNQNVQIANENVEAEEFMENMAINVQEIADMNNRNFEEFRERSLSPLEYRVENDEGGFEVVRINRVNELPKRKCGLRKLSLRGYRRITDKALSQYVKNLRLDLLDVTHTNVTKEGIELFLLYNPDCRVVHKDFCICKPKIPC